MALELLQEARIFTKLDRRSTYSLVQICEVDKWKSAFHTIKVHYKYFVMPYELTNTPAVFLSFINKTLYDMIGAM